MFATLFTCIRFLSCVTSVVTINGLTKVLVDETLALPTIVMSIGLALCVTGLITKGTLVEVVKWSLDWSYFSPGCEC